jgi:signal transduction histidine kinase
VIVVDGDRRLLDYNDAAAGTFPELVGNRGRPIGELLPALLADGAAADGGRAGAASTGRGHPAPAPFVSAFTRYGGSPPPREYTVTVTRLDADGRLRGYAVVIRDITDSQRRIRDLERQKAQLERFASTLSHDIRNPLNVARGRAELALEQDDPDHLRQVLEALDRIDRIIDDLLTLSREGRTIDDRQRVSLVDVAEGAWQTTDTTGAILAVEVDDHVSVYADRTRLLNVFENLFRNSVEHGSTGSRSKTDDSVEHGSTSNRTGSGDAVEHGSTGNQTGSGDAVEHGSTGNRTRSDDAVEHGSTGNQTGSGDAVERGSTGNRPETDNAKHASASSRSGSTAHPAPIDITIGLLDDDMGFYVADTGDGISPEIRERVFEAAFTTAGGSGLGLAIVRAAADAHGWSHTLTESATGGARFEFRNVTFPDD